jgi:20S proteasome alpha/beta subunit
MGDSMDNIIHSTPEGEAKRVKSNEREIARWLDDHYEQDMTQHHARDIVSLNFIKAHSEDFDDKGSDRYVYVGDGADS